MAASDLPIGSLFSGVGGLDLAVQAALGGHIAWHAESDPHAAQVLARHWPDVPNLGDVRAADWYSAEPVCVLTAGFPCQDLSVAGPRTGLAAGTRSGLWHHAARAIEALNPCLVVIENVRGLLSTRAGTHTLRHVEPCPRCVGDRPGQPRMRALGVLLADLADLGYDANWTCLRASDIGAPHRRERVFLTAWPQAPRSRTAAEDPHGEPGHQRRLPTPGQTQSRRPRPHPRRRDRTPPTHPASQRQHQSLTEPQARRCLHQGETHRARHASRGCRGGHPRVPAAPPGPIRQDGPRRHASDMQSHREPPHGGHSPDHWWGPYLAAIRRWEHVTGRAAPCPTQPGTGRLSTDFVEWMMDLPQGWVTGAEGLSRGTQLRLLGNSVVPHQAARALEILLPGGIPAQVPAQRHCPRAETER